MLSIWWVNLEWVEPGWCFHNSLKGKLSWFNLFNHEPMMGQSMWVKLTYFLASLCKPKKAHVMCCSTFLHIFCFKIIIYLYLKIIYIYFPIDFFYHKYKIQCYQNSWRIKFVTFKIFLWLTKELYFICLISNVHLFSYFYKLILVVSFC